MCPSIPTAFKMYAGNLNLHAILLNEVTIEKKKTKIHYLDLVETDES